jgi:hypothetical protein
VVTDVQTDGYGFNLKRQNDETIFLVEDIAKIFYQIILETISQRREGVNTQLVVSRTRWAKIVASIRD